MTYQLLDSGDSKKLEAFGSVILQRPSPHALWRPQHPHLWDKVDRTFTREKGWSGVKQSWILPVQGLRFILAPTDFGHVGFFPEHISLWKECSWKKGDALLNLFGYTGAFSIYAASQGAQVTHVDASKPAVSWAKNNAAENGITNIRWIVEDALKFLKKEVKRGHFYQGVIMDPPSFGRGAKGEVFQIEKHLAELFSLSLRLLKNRDSFLLASCHTPGFTPLIFQQILAQMNAKPQKTFTLFLGDSSHFQIPAGVAVLWHKD